MRNPSQQVGHLIQTNTQSLQTLQAQLVERLETLRNTTDQRLIEARQSGEQGQTAMRESLEARLTELRQSTDKNLAEMRGTVELRLRELQSCFADALLAGELRDLRRARQPVGEFVEGGHWRQTQRIDCCCFEGRIALAPHRGQVLARCRLLLRGAGMFEFGTGQRRLGGEHDRLGRGACLQPMLRTGDRAPALPDVEVGDLALLLRRHHGEIATRHLGEQIETACLALQGQRIDPRLRNRASRIQLAAAFEHRG